MGLVPCHHSKLTVAVKQAIFFGFPVHMKVMFTLQKLLPL